ncbi:MAG: adenosine monophosphate-protein transferase [Candidatus Zixiibacteriota bacterium]|nr:MAG: adenosine monophosphate-protein transferase [candidate division Zixibacteria bacterium]
MAASNLYKEHLVKIDIPEGVNVIFGQTHFIKTVEDLYETLVTSSPSLKFGIAFCEASQQRLVRTDGNDAELTEMAQQAAFDVGCGHSFFVFMKDGFPINVLGRVKAVDEVCGIYCATANPLQVIVAETDLGRGVKGVIDGQAPIGIETADDKKERMKFLRKIGYKR